MSSTAWFGSVSKLWLFALVNCNKDIEGGTTYWSSSTTTNQNFFQGLVTEAKSLGMSFGVYTSSSQWSPIMGSSYTGGMLRL